MCFADNLNSNVVGNKAKTSHVGTVSKWGGNRDRERERETHKELKEAREEIHARCSFSCKS